MTQLRREWLVNAYQAYVDDWLWDTWGYAKGWSTRFPEMILWYSTAGSGVLNGNAADTFVKRVRSGRPLPEKRIPTWTGAKELSGEICKGHRTNPVDWFTGRCGDLEAAWKRLQQITNIRAKIASFIMRDLSLMRDYSKGEGGTAVTYRDKRDRCWFDRLALADQALFLPVDVYVFEGARLHRASSVCVKSDLTTIQADSEIHRQAATEIVEWARNKGFDPRDVDMYWYQRGAGAITRDGKQQ